MSDQKISVVIPSAWKAAPDGELWLTHALRSVAAQTLQPCEVIVGLDPGHEFSGCHANGLQVSWANGHVKGHQAATNAACKQTNGTLIAMLEDDDVWEPEHLETLYRAMQEHGADFVSCSQQQVTPDGADLDVFHFATASTWLMQRGAWLAVGGFDERFKIHHDNALLGELNRIKALRLHLVRKNEPPHPWLDTLAHFTPITRCLDRLTVRRTVHAGSVLGECSRDDAKAQRSAQEYHALIVLTGGIPW